jgi:hypothetical protein
MKKNMTQDEALEVFLKLVKDQMKKAGSEMNVEDGPTRNKLYKYFKRVNIRMGSMTQQREHDSRTRRETNFWAGGSSRKRKVSTAKRPSNAACTRAQKLGIRLTRTRNGKRVYKTESMLRTQIKNAQKRKK